MTMTKKIIIIAFAMIFIGFSLAIGIPILRFWGNDVKKATIRLDLKESYNIGDITNVAINIDTKENTINAAEVYLTFDPQYFEVLSVDKAGSFFQIWIDNEPKFSNSNGTISFAGGLPTPGFKGMGKIGSVTIKAKKSGSTQINFTSKSRLLLDDTNGTFVPLRMDSIKVKIK